MTDTEGFDKAGYKRGFMQWNTFMSAVEQMKHFPRKIKEVVFVGAGEPTLNKHLPDMIREIRQADVAETVMVITNGSTLTPELSHKLVEAGLQVLRISLQGIKSEKYWEISQAKIDWDEYYNNIVYFSSIKGECKLKIKIADIGLDAGEEDKFYALFGDICDAVAVEHIYDACTYMEKEYNIPLCETNKTQFGHDIRDIKVCWLPFIRMAIHPNGLVAHCSNALLGNEYNLHDISLVEQWNSEKTQKIWEDFLRHDLLQYIPCQKCKTPREGYHPEDILDGHEKAILERLKRTR